MKNLHVFIKNHAILLCTVVPAMVGVEELYGTAPETLNLPLMMSNKVNNYIL